MVVETGVALVAVTVEDGAEWKYDRLVGRLEMVGRIENSKAEE